MKNFVKYTIFINMFIFLFEITALADGKNEQQNNNLLFKIERSRDADEIYYEVNTMADGTLDTDNPIRIYWVKHTENGHTEPLTKIQKSLAYGLKYLTVTPETAEFQFVSFEQSLILQRTKNGIFRVFSDIDGQKVEVHQIYIEFLNNSFWFPKIGKVEMVATIPNTRKILAKEIKH